MAHTSKGPKPLDLTAARVEELLKANFTVPDIANITGTSVRTVRRRMTAANLTVRGTYSSISDADLHEVIASILLEKPNTGMKMMRGFLLSRGIRITERRLRTAMRTVDPIGTEERKKCNRAINRRVYNVRATHSLWHVDTNMKMVRYRLIVKGCIDGKSRLGIYISVANNNTALSSLESFMVGVRRYGVPSRTRSDKGGENTALARFMITARGVGRRSHITGRSVHNQRIERFWKDINALTIVFYNLFMGLEQEGMLDVDNENHMFLLHAVFIPRIEKALEDFRQGWNSHPLSTEGNYSPNQLAFLYADEEKPTTLDPARVEEIYEDCRRLCANAPPDPTDNVRHPARVRHSIPEEYVHMLLNTNFNRPSVNNGKDLYIACLNYLRHTNIRHLFA